VDVDPRYVTALERFAQDARKTAQNATAALSTTDGRWAVVSTSVTALIAGSIAWLAAGTVPPTSAHYGQYRDHSLMPYELFMRLAAQNHDANANYASFTPGPLPANTKIPTGGSPNSLDNNLAAEQNGDDSGNPTPGEDARTITMESGQTLAGALMEAGVTGADASAALHAMKSVYDPRLVRAGQSFDLSFAPSNQPAPPAVTAKITYSAPSAAAASADQDTDESANIDEAPATPVGKLLALHFSPTIDSDITITRDPAGTFTASNQQKQLQAQYHRAGATIDSSLYLAAMQAGIPAKVVVEMIHMFSYKVDFQRDIKPGDSFQVLYSYYYTPDGQPAKEGDIQFATMNLGGRKITLYRYQPKGGDVDYFDSRGVSAKGMLMKTPVDGARITSGFGMRFHPILGYTRMHKGIDFGVPLGTPVMAAGAGTIEEAGWKGGYGNFVLMNHGNGYETAYGHLSRFAPGIHPGTHVRQGQIIAFSGSTGESTGPHLHYEIRINKQQVNPLSVKIATGRMLAGHDLRDFLNQRIHVDLELASMPLEGKVPDSASADLRAAKD
jgi:murein DD-endopeptidase MepM/ murein hydrolase activator NlpD